MNKYDTPEYVQYKHGGPDFVDPKKAIKQDDTLSVRLQQALNRHAPVRTRLEQRNLLVDDICRNFETYADKESRINVKDFKKYEILFSHELRDRYLNKELSYDEQTEIENLSNEFCSLVNIQKPIHIVDDDDKDVIPPLPPLYMRLSTLYGNGTEAINIFHNACTNDDRVPGGLGVQQREKATANLTILLKKCQDQDTIMENIHQFDELAENFHKKVLGKSVFHPEENEEEQDKKEDDSEVQPVDESIFDFEPM